MKHASCCSHDEYASGICTVPYTESEWVILIPWYRTSPNVDLSSPSLPENQSQQLPAVLGWTNKCCWSFKDTLEVMDKRRRREGWRGGEEKVSGNLVGLSRGEMNNCVVLHLWTVWPPWSIRWVSDSWGERGRELARDRGARNAQVSVEWLAHWAGGRAWRGLMMVVVGSATTES